MKCIHSVQHANWRLIWKAAAAHITAATGRTMSDTGIMEELLDTDDTDGADVH